MGSKLWQCHADRGVLSRQLPTTSEITGAMDCKEQKYLQP